VLNRARILAAAGSVDYLIFSFLAYFVIERYGRRRVMMCSALACSICWTVISIALGLSQTGKGNTYQLGALATAFFCKNTPPRFRLVYHETASLTPL
jgi:MFS family permease